LCFQTVLLIGPISSMNRESNFCEKPRLRERQKERETERERGRDVPGGMWAVEEKENYWALKRSLKFPSCTGLRVKTQDWVNLEHLLHSTPPVFCREVYIWVHNEVLSPGLFHTH
jgi:hypothetical protein